VTSGRVFLLCQARPTTSQGPRDYQSMCKNACKGPTCEVDLSAEQVGRHLVPPPPLPRGLWGQQLPRPTVLAAPHVLQPHNTHDKRGYA
jgi:hypothetical protein